MLFQEFLSLRGQMGDTKRPCEQRTHAPQELNASSHLSLGSCAEPEWNRDFVGQGVVGKAFWMTDESVNKAWSQQDTGYICRPAQPGKRVSGIMEKRLQMEARHQLWKAGPLEGVGPIIQVTGGEQRFFEPPCCFVGMGAAVAPGTRPAGGRHWKQRPAQEML